MKRKVSISISKLKWIKPSNNRITFNVVIKKRVAALHKAIYPSITEKMDGLKLNKESNLGKKD